MSTLLTQQNQHQATRKHKGDQRENTKNGSDDEDDDVTDPFLTEQENKEGIATVKSNVGKVA